jgi:hypothetical protein
MTDLIDELLVAGDRSHPYYVNTLTPCRWCRHPFHGLPCRDTGCGCDSAFTARDDSWRPRLGWLSGHRALQVMHDTGADGWAARLATGPIGRNRTVRAYLYGEPQ